MEGNPDVIDRADSLMRPETAPFGGRRRRSFVAASMPTSNSSDATASSAEEEDDLPVLTEVVAAEEPGPAAPSGGRPDEIDVNELASEIVQAIGQQMAFELPTLIEATLLNASEELRNGITSTMETALRDFIARRRQLRLPLGDPDTNE